MMGSIIAALVAVLAMFAGYGMGALHGYATGVADGRRQQRGEQRYGCGVCGEGEGQ